MLYARTQTFVKDKTNKIQSITYEHVDGKNGGLDELVMTIIGSAKGLKQLRVSMRYERGVLLAFGFDWVERFDVQRQLGLPYGFKPT